MKFVIHLLGSVWKGIVWDWYLILSIKGKPMVWLRLMVRKFMKRMIIQYSNRNKKN